MCSANFFYYCPLAVLLTLAEVNFLYWKLGCKQIKWNKVLSSSGCPKRHCPVTISWPIISSVVLSLDLFRTGTVIRDWNHPTGVQKLMIRFLSGSLPLQSCGHNLELCKQLWIKDVQTILNQSCANNFESKLCEQYWFMSFAIKTISKSSTYSSIRIKKIYQWKQAAAYWQKTLYSGTEIRHGHMGRTTCWLQNFQWNNTIRAAVDKAA